MIARNSAERNNRLDEQPLPTDGFTLKLQSTRLLIHHDSTYSLPMTNLCLLRREPSDGMAAFAGIRAMRLSAA